MTFAEIDQKYLELKQQFDAGILNDAEFDEALKALMIQDEQGRWWAKARDTGQWNYYDAVTQNWTASTPPSAASTPPSAPRTAGSAVPEQQYVQPAPQAYGAASYGAGGQPELSSGLKVVFYILSFLVPIVGIVLFFVYRGKPAQQDRSAANLFLILGLISFGLSCVCSFMIPFMLAPFSY
jgi:hypothetical protein